MLRPGKATGTGVTRLTSPGRPFPLISHVGRGPAVWFWCCLSVDQHRRLFLFLSREGALCPLPSAGWHSPFAFRELVKTPGTCVFSREHLSGAGCRLGREGLLDSGLGWGWVDGKSFRSHLKYTTQRIWVCSQIGRQASLWGGGHFID